MSNLSLTLSVVIIITVVVLALVVVVLNDNGILRTPRQGKKVAA